MPFFYSAFHVLTVLQASRIIDTVIVMMGTTMAHFPGRNESVNHAEFLFASTAIAFAARNTPMATGYEEVLAFLYSTFKMRVRSHSRIVKHRLLHHARL